jgi:hypothetical protein
MGNRGLSNYPMLKLLPHGECVTHCTLESSGEASSPQGDPHYSRLVTTIRTPDSAQIYDFQRSWYNVARTGRWHKLRLIGRLLDPAAGLHPTL